MFVPLWRKSRENDMQHIIQRRGSNELLKQIKGGSPKQYHNSHQRVRDHKDG